VITWQVALLVYAIVAGIIALAGFFSCVDGLGEGLHIMPRALFWPVWLGRWIARGTVDLWRNG
jgi:hypothetical protein